jgi:hypothetical protein
MKRTILPLLGVALLMLAGSLVMAQSDYGGTDQPADTSTTTTAPSTNSTGTTVQEGSTGSPSGSSMQSPDPADGSTYDASDSAAQNATSSHAHGSLPRTASDVPLVFGLGVIGAGAFLALRAYRTRNAQ